MFDPHEVMRLAYCCLRTSAVVHKTLIAFYSELGCAGGDAIGELEPSESSLATGFNHDLGDVQGQGFVKVRDEVCLW